MRGTRSTSCRPTEFADSRMTEQRSKARFLRTLPLKLSPLAIGCSSKGCSDCSNKTRPKDGGGIGPAGLSGTYVFDTVGTEPFQMTVQLSGTWSQGTGTSGQTSFSTTVTATVQPAGPGQVTFSVDNLKRGTWGVTAKPTAVARPITCQRIIVPGLTILNVAGGQPSCNPN